MNWDVSDLEEAILMLGLLPDVCLAVERTQSELHDKQLYGSVLDYVKKGSFSGDQTIDFYVKKVQKLNDFWYKLFDYVVPNMDALKSLEEKVKTALDLDSKLQEQRNHYVTSSLNLDEVGFETGDWKEIINNFKVQLECSRCDYENAKDILLFQCQCMRKLSHIQARYDLLYVDCTGLFESGP